MGLEAVSHSCLALLNHMAASLVHVPKASEMAPARGSTASWRVIQMLRASLMLVVRTRESKPLQASSRATYGQCFSALVFPSLFVLCPHGATMDKTAQHNFD